MMSVGGNCFKENAYKGSESSIYVCTGDADSNWVLRLTPLKRWH